MQSISFNGESITIAAAVPHLQDLGLSPTAIRLPLKIWDTIREGAKKFRTPLQYAALCGITPTSDLEGSDVKIYNNNTIFEMPSSPHPPTIV